MPCYHGVISADRPQEREGYENTVSLREFEEQMEWLGQNFQCLGLKDAMQWLERPIGGKPALLVSFDDGYRNNLTLAAPVLKRLGIPAIFFMSTGYIGGKRLLWPLEMDARLEHSAGVELKLPGESASQVIQPGRDERKQLGERLRKILKGVPNQERMRYLEYLREKTVLDTAKIDRELNDFMSWEEVRQLAAMGFDIGAHTEEHPILSRLNQQELDRELGTSKQKLEQELGAPIRAIAYPNGGKADYTSEVIKRVKYWGYSEAFCVDEQMQKPWADGGARYEISRVIVPGHLARSTFRFLASGIKELGKQARN